MKKMPFVFAVACLLCAFRPAWASPEATQALFRAAASGSPAEIRCLIERGADVNAVCAASSGTASDDLQKKSPFGWTPLMFAAADNGPEAVRILLDARADIDARCPRGRTAFMLAAEHNPDVEVLRTLLATGKIDVNDAAVRNENPFPFFLLYSNPLGYAAAGSSNPDVITFLLGTGARVNSSDRHGHIPLHLAARYSSHPAVVRRLLDAGADVALIRESPLTEALVHSPAHPEIVGMLLDAGCEIRPGDLDLAIENGANVSVPRLLQEHGLDIGAASRRRSGRNSLIVLALRNKNASFDMVRFLAEAGAADGFEDPFRHFGKRESPEAQERFLEALALGDAEVRDRQGENLLTHIVRGSYRADVKRLLSLVLDAGLNVDARNARGETALMLAVGRPKLVAFLASRGADVNATTPVLDREDYEKEGKAGEFDRTWRRYGDRDVPGDLRRLGGQSALMQVAEEIAHGRGKLETAKTLLDLGADVDLRDALGRTPLMVAAGDRLDHIFPAPGAGAKRVVLELIDLLADRGARIDAVDSVGQTALMKAAAVGCRSTVVRRLLDLGTDANLRDRQGSSALMQALGASSVDLDGLAALVDATRDPASLRNGRDTALKLAVSGNPERVIPLDFAEKLLAREWTPEEKNEALAEVSSSYSLNVDRVEFLIRHGADINGRGTGGKNVAMKFLSLGWYGRDGDIEGLRSLIALGLDVNARDDGGNTLLILADDPYIPLLLEAGADVTAANARGQTCLHAERKPGTLQRLLDAGALPDAVDADGRTPLFFEIYPESLNLLLARGADANRRASGGQTPLLSWIVGHRELEGLRALLDAGAEVDGADDEGRTPLLLLVEKQSYDAWAEPVKKIAFLLERGADVNRKRSDGATSLSLLVRQGTTLGLCALPSGWTFLTAWRQPREFSSRTAPIRTPPTFPVKHPGITPRNTETPE